MRLAVGLQGVAPAAATAPSQPASSPFSSEVTAWVSFEASKAEVQACSTREWLGPLVGTASRVENTWCERTSVSWIHLE